MKIILALFTLLISVVLAAPADARPYQRTQEDAMREQGLDALGRPIARQPAVRTYRNNDEPYAGLWLDTFGGTRINTYDGRTDLTGNVREGDLTSAGFTAGLGLRWQNEYVLGKRALPYFLGVNAAGVFGDGDRNLFANYHPGADNDTGIRHNTNWTVRVGGGAEIAALQETSFYALLGLEIEDECLSGYVDETTGGGTVERFRNAHVQVGPYVGFEARTPISFLVPGTQVYLSGTVSYYDGEDWSGTSGTARTYQFRTEANWKPDIRAGVIIPLNTLTDRVFHH